MPDAVRKGLPSQSSFHALFHVTEHAAKDRPDIMPDDTGVFRILVQIKQMQFIRLHHASVYIQKRDIFRRSNHAKTADTTVSLDDSSLAEPRCQFADVTRIGSDTGRDLIRIHRCF